MPDGDAMVMGDTVVFADEVDAAMDAAFAHGLDVTAIHNHFFHDTPASVLHAHRRRRQAGRARDRRESGMGRDPFRARRARRSRPTTFGGAAPSAGQIDAAAIEKIVGQAGAGHAGRAEGDDRPQRDDARHARSAVRWD